MPTEDEWLLAAGPDVEPLVEHAWCADNSPRMTQEVGTRAPNTNGLHDMFGNLWEYCANPFSASEPELAQAGRGQRRLRSPERLR